MPGTLNCLLNSLLPEPLQVSWIGNGSDMLVLTDANSRSGFQDPSATFFGVSMAQSSCQHQAMHAVKPEGVNSLP